MFFIRTINLKQLRAVAPCQGPRSHPAVCCRPVPQHRELRCRRHKSLQLLRAAVLQPLPGPRWRHRRSQSAGAGAAAVSSLWHLAACQRVQLTGVRRSACTAQVYDDVRQQVSCKRVSRFKMTKYKPHSHILAQQQTFVNAPSGLTSTRYGARNEGHAQERIDAWY